MRYYNVYAQTMFGVKLLGQLRIYNPTKRFELAKEVFPETAAPILHELVKHPNGRYYELIPGDPDV